MVATFVVDTKVVDEVGIEGLVVIDEEYKSMVAEAKQKSSSEASGGVSKS